MIANSHLYCGFNDKLPLQAGKPADLAFVLLFSQEFAHLANLANGVYFIESFTNTAEIANYDEKRIHYSQEVKRKNNGVLIAKATAHIACVDQKTGKACMPDIIKKKRPPEKYTEIE